MIPENATGLLYPQLRHINLSSHTQPIGRKSQMTVNTQWFKDRLAERHLSQRGLARLMGIDSSAISLMLRGRREMKLTEAAQLAALIGVPAEEVLANVGVNLRSAGASVPIVATLDDHGEVQFGESEALGEVPRPPGDLPTDLGAIVCRTAGSQLDYMDRWLLFFHNLQEGVNPESIERLSLVKQRGSVTTIGQVKRSYARGRWDVSCALRTSANIELEFATPILLILP